MTSDLYTFEHDGGTYTFEEPLTLVTSPKFLRAHRRRDELDLTFTIIEEVGGAAVCEVVDAMTADEFKVFAKDLQRAMGASLGE